MPRQKRITKGGLVYHVLNRANGKLRIFRKDGDFRAFERIIAEALDRFSMRLCGYCIMGNHWHMLLWPLEDGDLSEFMQWLTLTHTQRWHVSHGTVGVGHLYQGRYKSFPIQSDEHYLAVMRYIEANPLRAGIVNSADDWPWSSLAIRHGSVKEIALSSGPKALPRNWPQLVGRTVAAKETQKLENCIKRGSPYGSKIWTTATASQLGLQSTLRPKGRPKKGTRYI
ncbi:MAG: transposase [Planctomycetes bacterium]|nr:transposase [Planctomycetota bacterium]